MFNGKIGDKIDKQIQDKYRLKVDVLLRLGFRHFWNTKRPITSRRDLRGDEDPGAAGQGVRRHHQRTRRQRGADGVERGDPAAQQGVVDGGDLPIVNMLPLKIYEVSKYSSLTYHNYGPTLLVMNLDVWNGFPSRATEAHP